MTCAETLKTVLTGYDWTTKTTYGKTPEIGIEGIDNLSNYTPDSHIFLRDDGEDPEFTSNGVRLVSPQYCFLELIEANPTKRTNLYAGLKSCFQTSSYEITFSNVKPLNKRQPYQITLRVQILL